MERRCNLAMLTLGLLLTGCEGGVVRPGGEVDGQIWSAPWSDDGLPSPDPPTLDLGRCGGLPPEPENVTVTFDGVPVPRSTSNNDGWNYTAGGTEITFFGSYCDRLRQGQVKQVRFLFGCKGPVIE